MILLIEDDPAIVDATLLLLKAEGFEVMGSSDAQEALSAVQGGLSPDLIIVDNRMPTMTGIEFLEQIRDLSVTCPALLITGDPGANNIRNAKLENCVVLGKPIAPDRLIKFVNDALA